MHISAQMSLSLRFDKFFSIFAIPICYLQKNTKVKNIISDHWKSLENINTKIRKICLIHSKEINHKKDSFLNKRVVRVLNNFMDIFVIV